MARKSGRSFIGNFFKSGIKFVLSAAVLSVFVLGIAYGVKQASSASPSKLVGFLSPYLSKIGIQENQIGEVAGDLIRRATDFGISSPSGLVGQGDISDQASVSNTVAGTMAIIADSHIGNDKDEYIENKSMLVEALNKVEAVGADIVVHTGDITNFGAAEDLSDAKDILDASGLTYYVIPGDHDIAQTSNINNFVSVFGTENSYFELAGYKFVVFNNSANYTLISRDKMDWFETQLDGADFVILSQPIFTHDTIVNCQYMGHSCETVEDADLKAKQEAVFGQRNELLGLIRDSGVKAVIAGDHHMSSQTQDDEKPGLMHYVVGAVGGTFKEGYSQASWQTQRFSLMKLYGKGAFTVEDVIL